MDYAEQQYNAMNEKAKAKAEYRVMGTAQGQAAQAVRKFESGAVRSAEVEHLAYNLICPAAILKLAKVLSEGKRKYGEDNWAKGMPVNDVLNHVIGHLTSLQRGDISEDHIGHAFCNLMFLIHFDTMCGCHTTRARMAEMDKQYLAAQPHEETNLGRSNEPTGTTPAGPADTVGCRFEPNRHPLSVLDYTGYNLGHITQHEFDIIRKYRELDSQSTGSRTPESYADVQPGPTGSGVAAVAGISPDPAKGGIFQNTGGALGRRP